MNAAIVSIGDELTLGESPDGNAGWLAGRLGALGVETREIRVVPDDRAAIAGALRELAGRFDLVVATGGIGPTRDDLTREALGDVVAPDRELETDPRGLAHLERCFARTGRRMPKSNLSQATRPAGTLLLDNRRGTAMGIAATYGGCAIFVLPGPPAEMRRMFEGQVLPRLEVESGGARRTALVHAYGLGESAADELLGGLAERGRRPLVGITTSGSIVTARIRADTDDEAAARQVDAVRDRIGEAWRPWAYGGGDDTLASVTGALLAAANRTVATAESCTGGWLARLIVDVPGSSAWYGGGWVTYSDALKTSCLDVAAPLIESHGAVSEPVAVAMAAGALSRGGADEALAITGIAGPDGGSEARPVGTVFIALARRGAADVAVRRFAFPGDRADVRDRAAKSALQMLRFALLDVGPDVRLLWEKP